MIQEMVGVLHHKEPCLLNQKMLTCYFVMGKEISRICLKTAWETLDCLQILLFIKIKEQQLELMREEK